MRRFVVGWLALMGLLAVNGHAASAAPPASAQFFPGGAMRGQTVTVKAIGDFPSWPVEVSISDSGVAFSPEKDKGKFKVQVAEDAIPGVRLVRLFNQEGATPLGAFVVGTLPEIDEQEPNDETTKPQAMSLPSVTVNGRLEKKGDVDVFSVALRAGQTLVARIEADRPLGSPMDSVLQLLTASGFVVTQNHDAHGLDPQLVYTAPRDETMLVRLFSFPSVPDTSVGLSGSDKYVYRLTITTGPILDYAFPLAITRGEASEVRLHGWNLPPATPGLFLTPPADGNTLLAFRPEIAGTWPVAVVDESALSESEPNGPEQPQSVPVPFVVSGRIDSAGDVDVFSFVGKKKDRLVASVVSQRLGLPLDAVVTVSDAAGKQIAKKDDSDNGRDVEVLFGLSADGVYRVEVRDLYHAGSPRHAYYLSVVPAMPDFGLSVAAGEFVVAAGKTLEIPVTIDRRENYGEVIELTMTGLPAGATCGSATSVVKTDTAKVVKLTLTAGPQAFAGPVTIVGNPSIVVGQGAGSPSLRHAAQTTLKSMNTQTDQLWLTITAP